MMRCHHHKTANPVKIEDTYNKYYISITAPHAIGVIAKIGTICANKNVSLSSILQKGVSTTDSIAEITVITEKCFEKSMREIVSELGDDCVINNIIRVME